MILELKITMKKIIIALSFLPFSLFAGDFASSTVNKTGFTAQGGVSILGGNMDGYGIGPNGDTTGISFGGAYTFNNGVIAGGLYTPEVAEDSARLGGTSASLTIQSLSLFGGYHFDNNIRVTGGLTVSEIEGTISNHFYNQSVSENNTGINLGVGYEFNNAWSIETRYASMKLAGISGNTVNLLLGYKFK